MILKLYKGNRPFVVFLIILTVIYFWVSSFSLDTVTSYPFDSITMPFYDILGRIIPFQSVYGNYIALAFLLFTSFFLVQLNTKLVIIDQRTYMPAFMFLYIASSYVPMQRFHPVLIGSLFILFIIKSIFLSYKQEGVSFNYFESSLLLAIGSLFYFNFVFYLPLIWIGLIIFRPFKWREWVFTIIGFSLPYIAVFSYYYLVHGSVAEFLILIKNQVDTLQPLPDLNPYETAHFIWLGIIYIFSSIYMIWTFPKKKLQLRKYYVFFLWMFLITIAYFIFLPFVSLEIITCLSIPLAFLISHFYLEARSHYWGDIFILVSLVLFGIMEYI